MDEIDDKRELKTALIRARRAEAEIRRLQKDRKDIDGVIRELRAKLQHWHLACKMFEREAITLYPYNYRGGWRIDGHAREAMKSGDLAELERALGNIKGS